jgi:hypothetical protein
MCQRQSSENIRCADAANGTKGRIGGQMQDVGNLIEPEASRSPLVAPRLQVGRAIRKITTKDLACGEDLFDAVGSEKSPHGIANSGKRRSGILGANQE